MLHSQYPHQRRIFISLQSVTVCETGLPGTVADSFYGPRTWFLSVLVHLTTGNRMTIQSLLLLSMSNSSKSRR